MFQVKHVIGLYLKLLNQQYNASSKYKYGPKEGPPCYAHIQLHMCILCLYCDMSY